MKKKVVVLYDDRIRPNEQIAQVSGDKSYGSILFKQKTVQRRAEECVETKDFILSFSAFQNEAE